MHKIHLHITAALLAALLLAGCVTNQARHAAEHAELRLSLPQASVYSPQERMRVMEAARRGQIKSAEDVERLVPWRPELDWLLYPAQGKIKSLYVECRTPQEFIALGFSPAQRLNAELRAAGFVLVDDPARADAVVRILPPQVGVVELPPRKMSGWGEMFLLVSVLDSPISTSMMLYEGMDFLVRKSIAQVREVRSLTSLTAFQLVPRGEETGATFWVETAAVKTNLDYAEVARPFSAHTAVIAATIIADAKGYFDSEARDRLNDFQRLLEQERGGTL